MLPFCDTRSLIKHRSIKIDNWLGVINNNRLNKLPWLLMDTCDYTDVWNYQSLSKTKEVLRMGKIETYKH